MNLSEIFAPIIGQPEGQQLEYKATLIPGRAIAQIISAFANTEGGCLIFGVRDLPKGRVEIPGLSSDFRVSAMLQKAQSLMEPSPQLIAGHFNYADKSLFGIKVCKSEIPILVEGKNYARDGEIVVNLSAVAQDSSVITNPRFIALSELISASRLKATSPKKRFLDHYYNILRLYTPMLKILFPTDLSERTTIAEGKTLNRLLYSSSMDSFETYLSELLYEIYVANPQSLKAKDATVKVEEVLKCNDIEEFIQRMASKKMSKLQKGSIKGFLKENVEIKSLDALSDEDITNIELALQIRHLYSHRNGLVDDNFLEHFKDQYEKNTEHQLSISEVLDKMKFIVAAVNQIDENATNKYQLFLDTLL